MVDETLSKYEVAYALPDEQIIMEISGVEGMTVEEAVRQSGILDHYPEIDLQQNKFGIFGKAAKLDATLYPGDRVEIYRPLIADPKEVRRKRAAEGKKMGKGARSQGSSG